MVFPEKADWASKAILVISSIVYSYILVETKGVSNLLLDCIELSVSMDFVNTNVLNSKINLPSLLERMEIDISKYRFVKIPLFGWFAQHKEQSFVGNVFDFFSIEDWPKLFGTLCRDYSDCFDFKIPYSPHAEKMLFRNQYMLTQYKNAWIMSKREAQTHRVRYEQSTYLLKDVVQLMGMPYLLENGVGYISENLVNTFPRLELHSKLKYKKSMLIPTFCSPNHICSLETARLSTLNERDTLFVNGEKGWYGKSGGEILASFNEIKIKPGATWDPKLDLWTAENTVLSEHLQTDQLIKIWSESPNTKFEDDIVSRIVAKQGDESVERHLAILTYEQVQELEKKVNRPLLTQWFKTKEQQYIVNGRTIIRRGAAYYIVRLNGEKEQISNFSLDIHSIEKRANADGVEEFYCIGNILYMDNCIPFELADRYLTSSYLFQRGIRQQFLSLGIGVPFMNERFVKHIMTMIQLNCQGIEIVKQKEKNNHT